MTGTLTETRPYWPATDTEDFLRWEWEVATADTDTPFTGFDPPWGDDFDRGGDGDDDDLGDLTTDDFGPLAALFGLFGGVVAFYWVVSAGFFGIF